MRLAGMADEKQLHILFDILSRAPKQLALLMKYVEYSGILGTGTPKEVSKKELLQRTNVAPSVLNGLVDKKIFEIYYHEIGRLDKQEKEIVELNPLNEFQQRAFDEVVQSFQEKNVCLLHGVTSSGKTEIYIHLIEEAIRQGKQVLYLLPEIALTTQINGAFATGLRCSSGYLSF
mgnify:CR=1 FL=1